MPTLRSLVTSLNMESYIIGFGDPSWSPLIRELAKLPITHLSLKIKGGVSKEGLLEHSCWMNTFLALKGNLKTLDLEVTSVLITEKDKKKIHEQLQERLIKGYVRPKQVKKAISQSSRKSKKVSLVRSSPCMPTVIMPEQLTRAQTKHQAKIVIPKGPNPKTLGFKSTRDTRLAAEVAARIATDEARQSLLTQYAQLKDYATSFDFDAALVKIRLENAHNAVEALDKPKFESLAHSILTTLDEKLLKINTARERISNLLRSDNVVEKTSPHFTNLLGNSSDDSMEVG